MSFAVAIDGPAAAGKGTIARAIAAHFGFAHLDTGLLYRAVGALNLAGQNPVDAARNLKIDDLQEDALRTPEVAKNASVIAANPEVRTALLDFQRAFATRAGGAVIDGRDIGTVICPDAAVKLFVTASDNVRAERRWQELTAKGFSISKDAVLSDLLARDARDRARVSAPLNRADDAILFDTSTLQIDQAVSSAIFLVRKVHDKFVKDDAMPHKGL